MDRMKRSDVRERVKRIRRYGGSVGRQMRPTNTNDCRKGAGERSFRCARAPLRVSEGRHKGKTCGHREPYSVADRKAGAVM